MFCICVELQSAEDMIHYLWHGDDEASEPKPNLGMDVLCYVTAERLGHAV